MAFQDLDLGGLPTRVPLKKNAETKVYGGPMMQDRRHWHLAEAACGSNRRSLPSRPHNMLELTLQKELKKIAEIEQANLECWAKDHTI